ncbi:PHD finger protein ING2 isoform X3 [Populus alba]|uniref:PHD finger protein ING2 isoform X3 n=1 Tax=Populus alba TaxID=43335 RepID=UPI003CC72927
MGLFILSMAYDRFSLTPLSLCLLLNTDKPLFFSSAKRGYGRLFLIYSIPCTMICIQIDSHIKRLDEDLNNFAEDLKHEGKLSPDEPVILPPLPLIVPKIEKRRNLYGTPQSKRIDFRDRDWDRERDRDFELMPPPGSHKKDFTVPVEAEQPIDPNEPTYCVCHQVSFGDMIACDNENCQGGEWFHYSCVGLTPETRFKGKWYCPTCRNLPQFQWTRKGNRCVHIHNQAT